MARYIVLLLALVAFPVLAQKVFLEVGRDVDEATLNNPWAIAVDNMGDVWVTDEGNRRVSVFSNSGRPLKSFGDKQEGRDLLQSPKGIALDKNTGLAWVGDSATGKLYTFDYAGQAYQELGGTGDQEGAFNTPHGIALAPDGGLWVADYGNNRVQKLDAVGNVVLVAGQRGSKEGEFIYPTAIAVDRDGNAWVADSGNARLQKLSPSGEVLGVIADENLSSPAGLVVDADNNLIVADPVKGAVLIYNAEGKLQKSIKVRATGVALDISGNIWTVSKAESRISQFTREGVELASFGVPSTSGSINRRFVVIR